MQSHDHYHQTKMDKLQFPIINPIIETQKIGQGHESICWKTKTFFSVFLAIN